MSPPVENYFLRQAEPVKSCLLALRSFILASDDNISEGWKYGMPFYCYKGKMCCYLWTDKKSGQPYMGIVEGNKVDHPMLLKEKRVRMKIMPLDAAQDLPIYEIEGILKQMLALYKLPHKM